MPIDPITIAIAALLGLVIGSFLNVVIFRLPQAMEASERDYCQALVSGAEPPEAPRFGLLQTLLTPASHCPSCKTPLRIVDNVPILSFIFLRGRCAHCRARISSRYPIIEAATAIMSAVVVAILGWNAAGWLALVLTWTLIALTMIDADTQYLPDDLTLPLLWLGLLANLYGIFVPLPEAVIGAIAGYLSLWSVYWLFKIVTGREGMGFGDFKLLAALGAWLGWKMLLPIVLISSVVGAIVGIGLIVARRHGRDIPIPFGPYLATAGFIALLFGRQIAAPMGL